MSRRQPESAYELRNSGLKELERETPGWSGSWPTRSSRSTPCGRSAGETG